MQLALLLQEMFVIASSVFRGHAPLGTSENFFDKTHCYKWDFKPIYFAQMCPQNAGNAASETQNSKNFRASMPTDPPTIVSSLWPPPQ